MKLCMQRWTKNMHAPRRGASCEKRMATSSRKNAKRKPTREDLAESALFAWAMTMHPGRLPARVEARVREIMPNRLAFLEELFRAQPLFENIGQKPAC